MTTEKKESETPGAVGSSALLGIKARTQNENEEACFDHRTSGCPSSAYDNNGRLTFSGMLLTMEDCSFDNWFAGRTPQMRSWGRQVLVRWREAGFPSLGEPPPNNCESSLLDFALGMMVGVMMPNDPKLTDAAGQGAGSEKESKQ